MYSPFGQELGACSWWRDKADLQVSPAWVNDQQSYHYMLQEGHMLLWLPAAARDTHGDI